MRAKFLALLVMCMVLGFSKDVSAYKVYRYREDANIRKEAAARNILLIPLARAQAIAAEHLGTSQIKFPAIEFLDARTSSNDFRPVYKLECTSANQQYIIVVDATNARVLDFEQAN